MNVWLLFVFIRRGTASDALAAFGAALWGTTTGILLALAQTPSFWRPS